MLLVKDVLREGAGVLTAAGVPEPERDAEWLLGAALGLRRGRLPLAARDPVATARRLCFESWCARRARREPLQYVLGTQPFRSCTLRVDERVLIPRPETERVVEFALGFHDGHGAIADVGTGSGAIAVSLALERPRVAVYATDISPEALALARENAARAGVTNLHFSEGDLLSALGSRAGECSLVVCNPPYVATGDFEALEPEVRDWEPRTALDGGPDGLAFYRRLSVEAAARMAPDAWIVLELGADQRGPVEDAFASTGAFARPRIALDYSGIERAVAFKKTRGMARRPEPGGGGERWTK